MTDNQPAPSGLSVTSAIRLYNSVAVNDENMVMRPIITARRENEDTMSLQKSIETCMSLDENGNSCRICRWNRSDLDIMESPCLCRGTVVSKEVIISHFMSNYTSEFRVIFICNALNAGLCIEETFTARFAMLHS